MEKAPKSEVKAQAESEKSVEAGWEGIGDAVKFRGGAAKYEAVELQALAGKEVSAVEIPKTHVDEDFGVQFGPLRLPIEVGQCLHKRMRRKEPAKWNLIGRGLKALGARHDDEIFQGIVNGNPSERYDAGQKMTIGVAERLAKTLISPDSEATLEEWRDLAMLLPAEQQLEVFSSETGMKMLDHCLELSDMEDKTRYLVLPKMLAGFCKRLEDAEPGSPEDIENRKMVKRLTDCGSRTVHNRMAFMCELTSVGEYDSSYDSEGTIGMDVFRGQLFDKFVEYGAEPVDAALTMLTKKEIGKRFEGVFGGVKELNLAQAVCVAASDFHVPEVIDNTDAVLLNSGMAMVSERGFARTVEEIVGFDEEIAKSRKAKIEQLIPPEMRKAVFGMQGEFLNGSLAMDHFAGMTNERVAEALNLAETTGRIANGIDRSLTKSEWLRFCLSDSAKDAIESGGVASLSDDETKALRRILHDGNMTKILSSVDGRSKSFAEMAQREKEMSGAAAETFLDRKMYGEARKEMSRFMFGMPLGELGVDLAALGLLEIRGNEDRKNRGFYMNITGYYESFAAVGATLGETNYREMVEDGSLSDTEKMLALEGVALMCAPGEDLRDKLKIYREHDVKADFGEMMRGMRREVCREASANFSEYMQKSIQEGAPQIGETSYGDTKIPILQMQGEEFALLVHKLGAYDTGGNRGAGPEKWDEARVNAPHGPDGEPVGYVSTSMIGDGSIVLANGDYEGEIFYGFAELGENSIIGMSDEDLTVTVYGDEGRGRIMNGRQDYFFRKPRQLLDRMKKRMAEGYYKRTGIHPHNEVTLDRYSGGDNYERLRPSHLVVFGEDESAITEEQKKHAAYFGAPILLIDKEKYRGKEADKYGGKL